MKAHPLIRPADVAKVKAMFGALPHAQAVPLLGPPPEPADGDSAEATLRAHETWYQHWMSIRRTGIGASEVATVNGIPGAYGSPFALWWDKKAGLRVESGNEDVMVMGTRLEVIIGEDWQAKHPEALLVRPAAGLYRHPALEWLFATPDFLAVYRVEGDPWPTIEPVECKAYEGGKGWGEPGTDQVPLHVKIQVLMQIDVLGATRGHVARMQGKRVTFYTIDAYPRDDEGMLRALIHRWQMTAWKFVETLKPGQDMPPLIDGSEATSNVLAERYADLQPDERAMVSADMAFRYGLALRDAADATERLNRVKNEMREAMRLAEYATDPNGRIIAQRRRYKRRTYTVAATEIDGIWPVGGGDAS